MSDYPDYFGVQTFPKYGAFLSHPYQVAGIVSGVEKTVFSLEAAALISGLVLRIYDVPNPAHIEITLQIDEQVFYKTGLVSLFNLTSPGPYGHILTMPKYDTVAQEYVLQGCYDIPISYLIELKVDNNSSGYILVRGYIYYWQVS